MAVAISIAAPILVDAKVISELVAVTIFVLAVAVVALVIWLGRRR